MPLKKFRVRHQKWISQNSTKGDPLGRQRVKSLRGEDSGVGVEASALSPSPLPKSAPGCLDDFFLSLLIVLKVVKKFKALVSCKQTCRGLCKHMVVLMNTTKILSLVFRPRIRSQTEEKKEQQKIPSKLRISHLKISYIK